MGYLLLLLLQLPPISVGNGVLDLVVIGCGPAGLALAAESAALGLKVGLIGPDLPFTNNYGVWEDEFKGMLMHASHSFSNISYRPGLSSVLNYAHNKRITKEKLFPKSISLCYRIYFSLPF